jgi:hypothetical protein
MLFGTATCARQAPLAAANRVRVRALFMVHISRFALLRC